MQRPAHTWFLKILLSGKPVYLHRYLCYSYIAQLATTYNCINVIAPTVSFSQSTYSVNEDDGPAQPVLVLSNPSSTDITVQVRDNGNTATGE